MSRYQKGKTNLDFTEATDSEWQWHQLGHMQICTSLQTNNHTSTPPLSFLQSVCPSCRPTNSVKALKAYIGLLGGGLIRIHEALWIQHQSCVRPHIFFKSQKCSCLFVARTTELGYQAHFLFPGFWRTAYITI